MISRLSSQCSREGLARHAAKRNLQEEFVAPRPQGKRSEEEVGRAEAPRGAQKQVNGGDALLCKPELKVGVSAIQSSPTSLVAAPYDYKNTTVRPSPRMREINGCLGYRKAIGHNKACGSDVNEVAKPFQWTELTHKRFLAAIFDVGTKRAKPKKILAQMQRYCALIGEDKGLTSEHIKSHLQKYRQDSLIPRQEFLLAHSCRLGLAHPKQNEKLKQVRAPKLA